MAGFDIDAMRAAVLQCDRNIKTFEDAIRKERETQAEYRQIIATIEDKAANPPRITLVRGEG